MTSLLRMLAASSILVLLGACESSPSPSSQPVAKEVLQPSSDAALQAICPQESKAYGEAPPIGTSMECRLPDGTPHGRHTVWYKSGKIKEDGTYARGQKHGRWTTYHLKTSKKSSEGAYVNGQKHGPWISWHKNGRPRDETVYEMGKAVSTKLSGPMPAGSPDSQKAP